MENPKTFFGTWKTLKFNEHLKKALENPGIYFECYF